MARPSTLTHKGIQRLREALSTGVGYESACALAGVAYRSFARWRAEAYRDRGPDEPPPPKVLRELREMLENVSAELERECLTQLREAAPKNWQASAWLLERRFPETWGRHQLQWKPPEKTEEPQPLVVQFVDARGETIRPAEAVPANGVADSP